jgi:ribosome-binding factor A
MKKPHHTERFSSFVRSELADFLRDELYCEKGVVVSIFNVESASSEGSVKVLVSVWPESHRSGVAKQLHLLENKAKTYLAKHLNRKYAVSVHFYVME